VIGFKPLRGRQEKRRQRVVLGQFQPRVRIYPRTSGSTRRERAGHFYGVSIFGERWRNYYWDKFQGRSVSSASAHVSPSRSTADAEHRGELPDFVHLVECALRAPRVEHTVVYGVSNNDSQLWTIGWPPIWDIARRTMAEVFRAEIEAAFPTFDCDDINVASARRQLRRSSHSEI